MDAAVGRKLIEGIRNPTIVENRRADELFDVKPATAAEAMCEAIREFEFRRNDQMEKTLGSLNPARQPL